MKESPKSSAAAGVIAAAAFLSGASPAHALELDWSGQFRAEYNYVHNYSLDSSDSSQSFDPTRDPKTTGGYYIPSGGSNDATFEPLFLKLKPKLVVNDNIYIKSELWAGDPVYGMFGNAAPYSTDQRQFYSNQSRGAPLSAQRFWGEFLSDIGTVQVGRAPLHWGLGVVWNSGDGLWDRYESTGDVIRLVSKFGALTIIPSYVNYSTGSAIGGSGSFTGTTYNHGVGSGALSEYSIAAKYENPDEDFEGGFNFIKRLSGASQDPSVGYLGPNGVPAGGINYNIYDLYGKKRIGKLSLAGELPITSGGLGTGTSQGLDYSTYAVATEIGYKFSDTWELQLKAGRAPGQQNEGSASFDNYKAFYFNPAYRLGMILFNYQLANFAGPNTLNNSGSQAALVSPYDAPIVNANYLNLGGLMHTDKWTFNANLIYAQADKSAASGQFFYNPWYHSLSPVAATKDQSNSLGVETDLGVQFQWDEYFTFRFDTGLFFPGQFYAFSNGPADNNRSTLFAASARIGISF